jgi:hypothetical protein
MTTDLLSLLYRPAEYSFSRIVAGDKSWFLDLYPSDHMFAASRDKVIQSDKTTIEAQRVMLMVFFSGVNLIRVNALLSGA